MFTYTLDQPRRPIAQALQATFIHASLIAGAVYATRPVIDAVPRNHGPIILTEWHTPTAVRSHSEEHLIAPRPPVKPLIPIIDGQVPVVDPRILVPTRIPTGIPVDTTPPRYPPCIDACPGPTVEFGVPGAAILSESEVDDSPVLTVPGALRYPSVLQAAGIEGSVTLSFVIDTLGHVEPDGITIDNASHPGFVAAARNAVLTSRFHPARKHHVPVRVRVRQTVTFSK